MIRSFLRQLYSDLTTLITLKTYTGSFENNSVVASEMQNVYTKVFTVFIDDDMALYGTPTAIWGTGYGSISMPANIVYSQVSHKWFAQVLGTPNSTTASITIEFSKRATVV